jgi:hypothetical protein
MKILKPTFALFRVYSRANSLYFFNLSIYRERVGDGRGFAGALPELNHQKETLPTRAIIKITPTIRKRIAILTVLRSIMYAKNALARAIKRIAIIIRISIINQFLDFSFWVLAFCFLFNLARCFDNNVFKSKN